MVRDLGNNSNYADTALRVAIGGVGSGADFDQFGS